jgi:hypothetical protein
MIKTGRPEFDGFWPLLAGLIQKNALDVVVDGQPIRGYRTPDAPSFWIRDYSDMLRALKYMEADVGSLVQHFADTQAENGRIFDYFTVFPEKLPCERENWCKYVRVPVEADVEYRFVKAAFLAWQAWGDDGWLRRLLPKMEKALHYILDHPWYWQLETGLVKRAYTIDTWDFAYTAGGHDWLQFQIDDHTFWGYMHGDNSGYYQAFRIMETLYGYFADSRRAAWWRERANRLRRNMNRICWNGRFYTHFVKITPVTIEGAAEADQLSLSNPMAVNRGVASLEMAVSIIREYRRRRRDSGAFAEWFSIDPPFPDGIFGDEKLKGGAYCNGGIMPLVGGELAKAAFDHGFETYGIDILKRYFDMVSRSGQSYLWYFPDGTAAAKETSTSPEASPADAWGSSAMAYALIEGLAGIEDRLKLFQRIGISPRWLAADIGEAEVFVEYAASAAAVGYRIRYQDDHILLDVEAPEAAVEFHVLLPAGKTGRAVTAGDNNIDFHNTAVGRSPYVDFTLKIEGGAHLKIQFG